MNAALGGDGRAVLIGHDWGAAAAYAASALDRGCWSRVVAASWPPVPAAIDIAGFAQMRRSWYVMLFQTAEGGRFVADPAFVRQLWELWAPHHACAADADRATRALADVDGGATVLALYRSLFGSGAVDPVLPVHPTLYVHGEGDSCIGVELVDGLEQALPSGSSIRRIPGVSHFPQLERPEEFNAAVLALLAMPSGRGSLP